MELDESVKNSVIKELMVELVGEDIVNSTINDLKAEFPNMDERWILRNSIRSFKF